VLGNPQFVLLPFQPYKLVYAAMLAEAGKTAEALRYVLYYSCTSLLLVSFSHSALFCTSSLRGFFNQLESTSVYAVDFTRCLRYNHVTLDPNSACLQVMNFLLFISHISLQYFQNLHENFVVGSQVNA
jgi:hypothetical protein